MKILIVEDAHVLNNGIALSLTNCEVLQAFSLKEARSKTDTEIDIVTGLESGADDYITKPFSLAVLRARVNAVTKRKQEDTKIFRYRNFAFDFENMKFSYDDTLVELSKTEQKLLKILVQNIGKTMSRDMLIFMRFKYMEILDRLEAMLDAAIENKFSEVEFTENRLSKIEAKMYRLSATIRCAKQVLQAGFE